jgi:hypothetical protein
VVITSEGTAYQAELLVLVYDIWWQRLLLFVVGCWGVVVWPRGNRDGSRGEGALGRNWLHRGHRDRPTVSSAATEGAGLHEQLKGLA